LNSLFSNHGIFGIQNEEKEIVPSSLTFSEEAGERLIHCGEQVVGHEFCGPASSPFSYRLSHHEV
jgi:hypothetical protein